MTGRQDTGPAEPTDPAGFAARHPGLDPDCARLLDAARAAGLPPLVELSPAEARERMRAGDGLCAAGPELLDVEDVWFDTDGHRVPVRRYVPFATRSPTVLVWFHGGGWVTGDIGYSDSFCRLLAATAACEVRSVEYRLAPEHPFPAGLQDAAAAVRWSGAGGRHVVVGGDSAGGNLAAVCAQRPPDGTDVVGQLLVYPATDCDVSRPSYVRNADVVLGPAEMTWFFDHYVPDPAARSTPLVAPLLSARRSGLPPAVIVAAGHDPLYDEGVAYADALREVGVPTTLLDFPSLVHGFLRFTALVPAAAAAASSVADAAAALVR